MRICHLSSGHRPDDDRIFFKEARSLARHHEHVEIVCPYPEHLPRDADGVKFRHIARPGGLRGRFVAVRGLVAAGIAARADVYHCHEPESLLAAVIIKSQHPSVVLFDSHELWGGVLAERFWKPVRRLVHLLYDALEAALLRRCDGGFAASDPIARHLAETLGADRVTTILNVPVTGVFGERERGAWGDETVICHDGLLTFARGLQTMAEAVRIVARRRRVVFKIIGDVFGEEREWLEAFVRENRLEGVIVRTGWLPYERVGEAMASCHIGLLGLRRCPNHVVASPNKVFNYLMYGLPFIAPEFVEPLQALAAEGLCRLADPESAESYANALTKMIDDREGTLAMSARAEAASRTRFRWEHMEPLLLEAYAVAVRRERLEDGHRPQPRSGEGE